MVVAVAVVAVVVVSWSLRAGNLCVLFYRANHRVPGFLPKGLAQAECFVWLGFFFAVRLISRRLDALSSVTGPVKFMRRISIVILCLVNRVKQKSVVREFLVLMAKKNFEIAFSEHVSPGIRATC